MISVKYETEKTKDLTDIGIVIREIRRRRDISQELLGELVGVTSSHISRIEKGDRTPSLELLGKILTALRVHIHIEDNK